MSRLSRHMRLAQQFNAGIISYDELVNLVKGQPMAPSAAKLDKSQVLYTDLVVLNFSRDPDKGFPIKSFHVHAGKQDMGETIDLAKAFILDAKLKAVHAGDQIPDLRLGRGCCIRGTQDCAIDYKFQDHKAGMAPTVLDDEKTSVLSGALAGIASE